MITIYGMPSCPDCAYVHDQIAERDEEFDYVDIGEHVRNLKEFIHLRDTEPVFDEVKKNGWLGIPCFVLEDGTVSVTPEDAGLKSKPADGTACKIDGSGC